MQMRRLALASAILLAVSTAAAAQSGPPPRVHNRTLSTLTEGGRQIFRLDGRDGDGTAWWPDTTFTTGTIDVDIRGRDVPQGSFVGVAFHGVDEKTAEVVYFRPFNFAAEDPVRRVHAVQYVSHPAHPWPVLREQHPGVYEKPVSPPPDANGWFHATIQVDADTVRVFVDRAATAALEVKRLTDRPGGWVGLWVGNTSPGDFANLTIAPSGRGAAAAAPAAPAGPAAPATPAAANLSGTYAGQIVPEGGGDPFEGRIVLADKGDTVEVMLGPRDEPLFAAGAVRRTGDALTFEADAPGDTPNHLAFTVTVRDGALTGAVTQTRDGQLRKARVAFTKQ
jgi:hypothetical protein